MRPLNCVITFVSVLCGAWIGKTIMINQEIILAAVVGFLVCAFGNIVNDLNDIEIDRINNPKRPLVSGQVKKNIAVTMTLLLAIIALLITLTLGLKPFLLVFFTILLLFFYAVHFKKMPFANFIVALIAGLSFVFGGFINDNILSLIPAIFALLIHTPREIIKDIIDIKGDKKFGVSSLSILYGEKHAENIARLFLWLLFLTSPLPYVLGVLNLSYLIVIGIVALPMIIITIVKLPNHHLASNLMKFIMLVGLVAFIIG